MSHKTVICFAIWTSFWSALFNHFYTVYFGSFGVPWIMFVCMAIFFGMNGTPKQVPGMILSAFCGLAWGQFDFIPVSYTHLDVYKRQPWNSFPVFPVRLYHRFHRQPSTDQTLYDQ